MPTYLDTDSLGPTPELAVRRCRELNLAGRLVPPIWRHEVLRQATADDTVICGPLALPFWRKLHPGARLYALGTLDQTDPVAARFETWLEWGMVYQGIPPADARRFMVAPPKTPRHQYHAQYQAAQATGAIMEFDGHRWPTLPEFEELVATTAPPVERPYQAHLVHDDDTLRSALCHLLQWEGRLGYDCETDVTGDQPNEYRDTLVGFALAADDACFYFGRSYLLTLWPILGTMSWVGHNAKYDLVTTQRALWNDVTSAIRAQPVPVAESSGLRRLVESPGGSSFTTSTETISITDWLTLLSPQERAIWQSIFLTAPTPELLPPVPVQTVASSVENADLLGVNVAPILVGETQHGNTATAVQPDSIAVRVSTGLPLSMAPRGSGGGLVGDSMLAAYLLGEPEAKLKALVQHRYNDQMITYDEVVGVGKSRVPISAIDPQVVSDYCCGDAYYGLRATTDLEGELDEQRRSLYQVDLALVTILAGMSERGVMIDRPAAQRTLDNLSRDMASYADAIDKIAIASGYVRPARSYVCKGCRNGKVKRLTCDECHGVGKFTEHQPFNPGSSDQVGDWLHHHLGLPVQRLTDTGKPSVDALSLLRLRDDAPAPRLVLHWKQMDKFAGYLRSWLEWSEADGALHSIYTLARTRTGRLSSENPNVQQVKRAWRRLFVAREGKVLIAADYGQIELRIPAAVSKDPKLLAAMCADPKSYEGDVHAQNVERIFGVSYADQQLPTFDVTLRTRAKNAVFGALYGSEGQEVQAILEKQIIADDTLDVPVPTVAEVHASIVAIRDAYPTLFYEWIPTAIDRCREQGGWAYTLYGRPQFIPEILSPDKYERKHGARKCISHIIQGTAGDIMRQALYGLGAYCRDHPCLALLLDVHDEVVPECDSECASDHLADIVRIMQLGQPLAPVPLVVDIKVAANWEAAH